MGVLLPFVFFFFFFFVRFFVVSFCGEEMRVPYIELRMESRTESQIVSDNVKPAIGSRGYASVD